MKQFTRSLPLGICLLCVINLGAFATPPAGYYDTADTTTGTTLRDSLHEIIDDHTRYPYTSTSIDTWDILELADEDPNNSNNILDVYRNISLAKFGGGTGPYNREHSWPKSYGFPNDVTSNYPYTDCHHLFLADSGYNSSRSNKPYRYCNASCNENPTEVNNGAGGGSGVYPGNSNWTAGSFTAGTWETWIDRRGDVARAQFYLAIRYEGGTHGITGASEPDLILTDSEALISSGNTGSNESVAYMGMLSDLLQWHLQDPVDDKERARNDIVYSFQGNRNPFIDHPEWVDCVFNNNCTFTCSVPADCDDGLFCNGQEDCVGGSCQSGSDPCVGQSCDEVADVCVPPSSGDPWINEFHYDNDSTDTGEFVEIAGPAGLNLSGWTVVGYNGNGGADYKTVSLSGVIPDQAGCMGTLDFAFSGMQNGSPDGLALVDPTNAVIEFISYEGSFTATSGPANGMISVDIGVNEPTNSPIGDSLQRIGTGAAGGDFSWQSPAAESPGQPNAGQTFDGCGGCTDDADCDDGVYCNGTETCTAGSCTAGTAVDCNDGVTCTDDSCNEATDSCDNVANDALCDDGAYCNGAETCDAVLDCQAGTAVNCDDGLFCNGTETCDPILGCQAGSDPCPGQLCDEASDSCVDCTDDLDCDDGLYCNGAETCVAGACQAGTAVSCNDGVGCTDDSCNEATDSCDNVANDANCDDGAYCNGAETCDVVFDCQAGTSVNCDDGVGCTDDSCNEATDSCDNVANDANCDDGAYCNGPETCDPALDCQAGTAVNCDDGVGCTDDSCNEGTDSCDNVVNDANCDDGLFCNGAETCDPILGCQTGSDPCPGQLCEEASDSCVDCTDDLDCDDGLYCNGAETCVAGACQAGTAVNCDDGVGCTDDSCNEATDSCDNVANDANCDDGAYCNGAETCDAVLDCQAGTSVNCDDGVTCTDDSCNETTDACDHVADDANCDDGLFCNGFETCDALSDCLAGSDPCPGEGCDEVSDTCIPTACNNDGTCDAGEDCDTCPNDCPTLGADPNNGICEASDGEDCITAPNDCNGKLNGSPGGRYCCGDGNAEYGVTCADSRCTAQGNTCTDVPAPESCCGDGLCEGAETIPNCAVDCAECTVAAECDDLDPCTIDDCVANACSNTPINCDDGDACTVDSCFGGSCFNDPIDCDDSDACTIDSCNAATGCVNDPLDCDDADACTDDSCLGGTCFNDPIDCDDGEACTVDTCDGSTGCDNAWPACGAADGCCGPACGPGNDPDCCGPSGAACSTDGDCCSNKCKGNGTCR